MKGERWLLAGLAAAVMAAGALALHRLSRTRELGKPGIRTAQRPGGGLEILLPERVMDYVSEPVEPTEAERRTLPKDTTFGKRLYRAPDGFQIFVNVVLMGTDRTSIHKPEYCLTSQGWRIVGQETIQVPIPKPRPYSLRARKFLTSRVVRTPSGRAQPLSGVYLFWFVADGRLAAGHFERIAWMTWDLLRTGRLPRWAYVACFADCPPGKEEAAVERMKKFLAAAVPEFQLVCPADSGYSSESGLISARIAKASKRPERPEGAK
ncbi:MAG: exosortase-associated EpsI family protein [Verrucomicrobia bacterium]|nr:exosortase-associated EpsI family protein [Verrucomicrobiota bacterium]